MTEMLVIGYGNLLRGDDGVGHHVVAALESLLPEGSAFAIHQLTPEWSETISHARNVVFVDAAVGDSPGEVRCLRLVPRVYQPGSHELTAEGVLSMSADLFGRYPNAHIVTITGKSFELSDSLTTPVAASVPVAARIVLELLGENKAPER
ncbi:MAG TPA: hydrogenase maturation protease [Promineifilum sp.]|nr:hydrogenase maturation protease [Promineifilum sp.]HRO22697.1 hydrogenase maturation protease [Promineifilum sp.]HRO89481.1 hydrogenase maturation protease [Promineifilum sp.]HRQ12244.1 hydrogenase maturation protease [Promineifilum sp.]